MPMTTSATVSLFCKASSDDSCNFGRDRLELAIDSASSASLAIEGSLDLCLRWEPRSPMDWLSSLALDLAISLAIRLLARLCTDKSPILLCMEAQLRSSLVRRTPSFAVAFFFLLVVAG